MVRVSASSKSLKLDELHRLMEWDAKTRTYPCLMCGKPMKPEYEYKWKNRVKVRKECLYVFCPMCRHLPWSAINMIETQNDGEGTP